MSRPEDPDQLTRREAIGAVAAGVALASGAQAGPARTPARAKRLPSVYLPHGGGPCFFMDWRMGPPDTWERMRGWLQAFGRQFEGVKALCVISAHWETPQVTVQTGAAPPLLYDYSGFPPHTYQLKWPAPGAPAQAARALALLKAAGIPTATDARRGFDHGVFVPLKVAFPKAHIPTFQISLKRGLDPAAHLAIGRALAPLRDEGVLIIGSGMSFHNMRAFMRPQALAPSQTFDGWLEVVCRDPAARDQALTSWAAGPNARFCHPREEHLLPLMVVAGAGAGDAGRLLFRDEVMGVAVSAHAFG